MTRVKFGNIWFSTLTEARRHFLKMSSSVVVFFSVLVCFSCNLARQLDCWDFMKTLKPPISSGSRCGNCREHQAITCWEAHIEYLRHPTTRLQSFFFSFLKVPPFSKCCHNDCFPDGRKICVLLWNVSIPTRRVRLAFIIRSKAKTIFGDPGKKISSACCISLVLHRVNFLPHTKPQHSRFWGFFLSLTWVSSDTTWGFPCELSASHVDLNFAHSGVMQDHMQNHWHFLLANILIKKKTFELYIQFQCDKSVLLEETKYYTQYF